MMIIIAAFEDRFRRIESLMAQWNARMPTGFTLFGYQSLSGREEQIVVGWRFEIKKGTVETALRSNEPFIKLADSVLVKFCGSEYVAANYNVRRSAKQRADAQYLYNEILLELKPDIVPVSLPRGVEQRDDISKYTDALVAIHDRTTLQRFVSTIQTFAKESWNDIDSKAMSSAAMRGDGNMVAKYFKELCDTYTFDELETFLKNVHSVATNIGVFTIHRQLKKEVETAPVVRQSSMLQLTPQNYDDKITAYKRRIASMLSSQIKVNDTYFDLVRHLLKKVGIKGVTNVNHLSHEDYAGSKSGILLLTKKGSSYFNANYKNLLDNLNDFGYNVYKIAKNSYVIGAKYREVVFIEFVIKDWDDEDGEGSHIIIYRSKSK